MEELIAKRYAKSLMDIAKDGELQKDLEVLRGLAKSMQDAKVAQLVSSPLVANSKKFELIVEPLKDKMSQNLYKLLEVMSEHNRLPLIAKVVDYLDYEIKLAGKSFEGVVSSDGTLKKDDIRKLEDTLSNYTGYSIKLNNSGQKIDGIKVEVEDLGIELSYSKERVKADLLAFIEQGL